MTDHLSVGVIIATYNRFDMCVEAVRSALAQTHTNLEAIVIDDQSTDERYATLVQQINDPRLKYIRLDPGSKQALGKASPGYVRNAGIRAFKGDYIAILDDDDVWLPTKIQRQLSAMAATGAQVCCTDSYFYNVRWAPHEISSLGRNVPTYNEFAKTRVDQLERAGAFGYKIKEA
jgi:glycosyltransferase involved in cell wall biosynthesis